MRLQGHRAHRRGQDAGPGEGKSGSAGLESVPRGGGGARRGGGADKEAVRAEYFPVHLGWRKRRRGSGLSICGERVSYSLWLKASRRCCGGLAAELDESRSLPSFVETGAQAMDSSGKRWGRKTLSTAEGKSGCCTTPRARQRVHLAVVGPPLVLPS